MHSQLFRACLLTHIATVSDMVTSGAGAVTTGPGAVTVTLLVFVTVRLMVFMSVTLGSLSTCEQKVVASAPFFLIKLTTSSTSLQGAQLSLALFGIGSAAAKAHILSKYKCKCKCKDFMTSGQGLCGKAGDGTGPFLSKKGDKSYYIQKQWTWGVGALFPFRALVA